MAGAATGKKNHEFVVPAVNDSESVSRATNAQRPQ
jgi:hypothetical protein